VEIDDEEQLKQRIGIDSWRNLSKEKFLTFVSDLPNMSEEVALKVVEQFPDFKKLVMGSFEQVHEQATKAVGTNWRSQKKVHKAFGEYREVLSRELERENLSAEDRFAVLKLFKEAIDEEAHKDSEHKAFVLRTIGIVAAAGAVVVAAGVAVLGGKSKLEI
jgi:truncated hemoglobin YjbI